LHAANADHTAGTFNLLDGLKLRAKREIEKAKDEGNMEKDELAAVDRGTFIHISGAASLINLHDINPDLPGKVYSDIDNKEEILELPENRLHVAVERRLMAEGEAAGVNVVILAPPVLFPSGTGIGKQDSYENLLARAIMKTGYPFVIGEGKNITAWISTDDLAEVVCFVIKEVLKGPESRLGYGRDGYYFCEAGEIEVMEQARSTAKVLKRLGAIKTSDLVSISPQKSLEVNDVAMLLWGSSMRTRADKLRKLGWRPKAEDWMPFVEELARVEFEARRLARRNSKRLSRSNH